MKTFLMALMISSSAFAVDCKVDGISDSPQKFDCEIKSHPQSEKLKLSCVEGKYLLQWMDRVYPVTVAYHEEVEEGSNPLVFVAEKLKLTTISHSNQTEANVSTDGKELSGTCLNK